MTEREVIERTGELPVTRARLVADLLRLGVRPGMDVLVHSSMSALGWVVGGAQTVLEALEEAVGPAGTLMMPAYSYSLPEPSRWTDPPVPESWWDPIRRNVPPFDPELSPTRGVGVVAELFRTQPGTQRSHHPNVSFSARGPNALHLLGHHSLDFGMGERSPLSHFYDLNGKVLLLGVDHRANSSIHLAEFRSRWKGRDTVVPFEGRMVRGHRVVRVRFRDLDGTSEDFAELGRDFEQATHAVTTGRVGCGEARLMDQREVVDYAYEWIPRHRGAEERATSSTDERSQKSAPTYLMKPPPLPGFSDDQKWIAARRRNQAQRFRRT
ncbi:MAG: AAC(3) family N-acetyltransferase [Euryarchaeota archaeon]|nr:AAC(3) family N-acetyltransferase [Euryarchaeota archaeon]MDE1837370.1 AAC(3) family N-acetyltransferase [Euryarchaeota archaeon]MDE1881821.1 AAC(3) family N-acetyltransferase [Euryarchaeota archaeon]MDE2045648.1 AAC(3) family N-acetyltransferase [Thermoplasmata archaeon]